MSELFSPLDVNRIVDQLNARFNCSVDASDFSDKSYSKSSLTDIMVQRYQDELSGEWTTERALTTLKKGLVTIGLGASEVRGDSKLEELFPRSGRRAKVKAWSMACNIELDALKPDTMLSGLLVFLFFAFIPLGIGLDWFLSGIGMAVCVLGIFILGKTASNFKSETLEELAESVAWKLYLKQQKKGSPVSKQTLSEEVTRIIENR